MIRKGLFKRPKNKTEGTQKIAEVLRNELPDDICCSCPNCKKTNFVSSVRENLFVCPFCGHHFKMGARHRINVFSDKETFNEMFTEIIGRDILTFPEYQTKIETAQKTSGEKEGAVCGVCSIFGAQTAVFAMEPEFMMGSMGSAVGEKITLLFEYATQNNLPVLGFCLSGGARMQEGMVSLMQMAKTSAAVKRHSDAGNLYVSVLCDPTTGGVTASFASLADIIIAEPNALICFAGPRVIEQTIRQKLPQGFQRAEFLLEKGFINLICKRAELKELLDKLLKMHAKRRQI